MTSTINATGLITVVDGAACLVGARCDSCGTHTFPVQRSCPRCGSDTSEVALPPTGELWSWTVQRIRPKPPYEGPEEFEPFAVGYVDVGPVRVESRLFGRPIDSWAIGQPVHLVVGDADADGDHWDYWFEGDDG